MNLGLNVPQCKPREELANSITHGIGAILSIGALGILTSSTGRSDPEKIRLTR